MKRLVAAICAAALAIPALAGEMTVTGTGSVSVQPDRMKMSLVVAAMDADIAVAKRQFSGRTAAFAATLDGAGVTTNELTASGLNIECVKDFEDGKRVFKGYRFSEEYVFSAKLDRVRLERLYAALVDCKCIENLSVWFELADSEAPRREARRLAVENAREIAEGLAAAAGVALGEIDEIAYRADDGGARLFNAKRFVEAGDEGSVGSLRDIEIADSVRIKWDTK